MEDKLNSTSNLPAFPVRHDDNNGKFYNEGMTLLDYFAAKAMQGLLAKQVDGGTWSGEKGIAKLVKFSYEYAAEMLKERKKYTQ